jgi:hypothetical protein
MSFIRALALGAFAMTSSTSATQARADAHGSSINEREPRRPVGIKGFATLSNGSRVSVSVSDLSYGGCRIHTNAALNAGAKVRISVLGLGGALDGFVRWSEEGRAGVCFDVGTGLPDAMPNISRLHLRHPVSGALQLRHIGRQQNEVRLLDVTRAGCKVEFVERPQLGETVWVKFNGLHSIIATVRWVEGSRGGIEFGRPMHSAVFDQLLERIRQA